MPRHRAPSADRGPARGRRRSPASRPTRSRKKTGAPLVRAPGQLLSTVRRDTHRPVKMVTPDLWYENTTGLTESNICQVCPAFRIAIARVPLAHRKLFSRYFYRITAIRRAKVIPLSIAVGVRMPVSRQRGVVRSSRSSRSSPCGSSTRPTMHPAWRSLCHGLCFAACPESCHATPTVGCLRVLSLATLPLLGVVPPRRLGISPARHRCKVAARIGMAAIMECTAVTQTPARQDRVRVVHDARAGRDSVPGKLCEIAGLTRVMQRMTHMTAARIAMYGAAKARGDQIRDCTEELADMSGVHGDRPGGTFHRDQRKTDVLIILLRTAVSVT